MTSDDTMRRIEEALNLLVETAEEGWGYQDERDELLATIRAALNAQPSPTSGESPAVSAEVAQKDAGGWGEDDDRFRANEEHERAVKAWRQTMCQEIENLTKHANKPGSETKFFGALFGSLKTTIDDGVRLMRRQPKETT